MSKIKAFFFAGLLSVAVSAGAETYSVSSPEGLNEIRLTTEPTLAYQVKRGGTAMTEPSAIALGVAGKPMMDGAGVKPRPDQASHAAALKGYVESVFANPQIVGVHWHQFSDQATSGRFDGEYYQVGWADVCDRPYPETVKVLRALDIYALR